MQKMKNKLILIVLMVLGLTFGALTSKAQSTPTPSPTSQTAELNAPTDELLASTVETKTTVSDNPTVTEKQKPLKPKKKDWEDRTLLGKILIVTGAAIFVVICVLYGTVSVG